MHLHVSSIWNDFSTIYLEVHGVYLTRVLKTKLSLK